MSANLGLATTPPQVIGHPEHRANHGSRCAAVDHLVWPSEAHRTDAPCRQCNHHECHSARRGLRGGAPDRTRLRSHRSRPPCPSSVQCVPYRVAYLRCHPSRLATGSRALDGRRRLDALRAAGHVRGHLDAVRAVGRRHASRDLEDFGTGGDECPALTGPAQAQRWRAPSPSWAWASLRSSLTVAILGRRI
jgi:hypothetical protein